MSCGGQELIVIRMRPNPKPHCNIAVENTNSTVVQSYAGGVYVFLASNSLESQAGVGWISQELPVGIASLLLDVRR